MSGHNKIDAYISWSIPLFDGLGYYLKDGLGKHGPRDMYYKKGTSL